VSRGDGAGWFSIARLGVTSARKIEAFFAAHITVNDRAKASVTYSVTESVVPCKRLRVPHELDGSRERFRASEADCTISANNDYESIETWRGLYEAAATQRAYRKELSV